MYDTGEKQSNYIAKGVSAKAVNCYVRKHSAEFGKSLHTLQICTSDKTLVRYAPEPYSCSDKREVYSLSKSFCSTAVGMLIDDGLLNYDTKIVDIFPEYLKYSPTPDRMKKMTLSHVMSMNSGQGLCTFRAVSGSPDPVAAFFAQELVHEPGSRFCYNTGNTYLLSLIVEKISGMHLLDFLALRLFSKLAIHGVNWTKTVSGANEGGVGIHISSDDMAKFGQLYLNDGVSSGERLLSHEWVTRSHEPVSDNSFNGSPDWTAGYGYQFWVNDRYGFRGDGANGQICAVLPEKGLVVAIQAEDFDMQSEMDDLYEMVEHLFDSDTEELENITYPCKKNSLKKFGQDGVAFLADSNKMGIKTFSLYSQGDSLNFSYTDGVVESIIRAGNGEWIRDQHFTGMYMTPKLGIMYNDFPEDNVCAACWHYDDCGRIVLVMRMTSTPSTLMYTFDFNGDTCTVTRSSNAAFAVNPENRVLRGKKI